MTRKEQKWLKLIKENYKIKLWIDNDPSYRDSYIVIDHNKTARFGLLALRDFKKFRKKVLSPLHKALYGIE